MRNLSVALLLRRVCVVILLLSSCLLANRINIRETMTNARIYNGYEFITMTVDEQSVDAGADMVWYVDNLMGYESIAFQGVTVSAGTAPTTLSAQAIYPNGDLVDIAAQTMTVGTDLTLFHSPWYKFTMNNPGVTRNFTLIFNVAD